MTKAPTKDLAEFDALAKAQEDGLEVKIKDPKGADLGFTIRIAGPDSERQKKAIERLTNERLQREDASPATAEEIANAGVRMLAMSVISWSPFILDGKELELTEENAVKLFVRFPFIKDQVDAKAGKRAAFLKG